MENGIFTIFARKKPICYDVFSFYGRVSIVLFNSLTSLADKYVHFNESDVPMFICDLVRSGKWQASFGTESAASNSAMSHGENSFLSRLAAEYKACKDKEANKAIRKNASRNFQLSC